MTEEVAGGEAPVIEPITTAPEAVVLSPETVTEPPARDFDAEAKQMGWVPKEEFRGPPDRWKDAKEWVEAGETLLPYVRSENKRLKAELEEVKKDYATRFERLDRAAQASLKLAKDQFDRELATLKATREAAVKAGDVTAFNAAEKQISDHVANAPKVEDFEGPKTTDAPVNDDKTLDDWKKANPWYETDDALTEAAIGISQMLLRKNPNITMAENLRQTEAAMRERFPLQIGGKSGANGHAPVDGGGDPKTPTRTDTLTAKLPSEALAMAKQAVKDGTYKSTEEWAKVYFS